MALVSNDWGRDLIFLSLMSYTSTWLWRSWLWEGAWATTSRVCMQWLFCLYPTTMLCCECLSCGLDAGTCIDHLSRSPQVFRSTTYKQVYLFQIHKPGSELLTRCDAFPFRMQSLCGMHLGCLTSCVGSKCVSKNWNQRNVLYCDWFGCACCCCCSLYLTL
jgi:hypothetical protein